MKARAFVTKLEGHLGRVGALTWNENSVLSSGSIDSKILNHDIRLRNGLVSKYLGHEQEICGLKWSPDGTQLASGGNDNMLCIWDMRHNKPRITFREHTAAVKAISWCPWQRGLLSSGGGSLDKTIKFWNT